MYELDRKLEVEYPCKKRINFLLLRRVRSTNIKFVLNKLLIKEIKLNKY